LISLRRKADFFVNTENLCDKLEYKYWADCKALRLIENGKERANGWQSAGR